jgi:hypothetical protein
VNAKATVKKKNTVKADEEWRSNQQPYIATESK